MRRRLRLGSLGLVVLVLALPASAAPVSPSPPPVPLAELRRLFTEAAAAHEKKDHALFLEKSQAALALAPRGIRAHYNVACGYALTGRAAEAVAMLDRITAMGAFVDAGPDADFATIKDSAGFKAALARAAALKEPLVSGVEAFRLREKDLITEGLAHDPKSGDFFLSSVHKRKIVRVARDGTARDFVKEGQDGLWSVLALRTDAPRRLLYATTVALPQGQGFAKEADGKSALLGFDVDTGRLVRSVSAPADGKKHNLNDVAIARDGTVFISDSVSSHLYRLGKDEQALGVLVEAGLFASPQGLALSPDEKTLFVADYALGLFAVDLSTKTTRLVDGPPDATLAGIDGLVADGRSLIAIQNGIQPHRVARFTLDDAGTRVTKVTTLDRAHPAYDEPTLGVLVGDDFFYVANSQWGSFTKDDQILPLDKLREPVVLRLRLR
jgi:sugar lactone lactonase YvrE